MRVLLVLTCLFSGLAWSAPTVITQVNGYTFDQHRQLQRFSVLAFDDGKVLATGNEKLLRRYPQARVINGEGKTLLPGIIDAHGHVIGLGQSLLRVDVRSSQSAEQAAGMVAAYAAAHPAQSWIQGRGWNQELWTDKAFPKAAQLDAEISDRPVWLIRVDGHAGWANSKALALAGIDADTPSPQGGDIVKDANGQPTGLLVDNAMSLIQQHLPEENSTYLGKALDAASEHLLSQGITSVHDAGISQAQYRLYLNRAAKQQLDLRLYAMLAASDPALPEMLAKGPVDSGDDFLSIRSVKVYGDGALGSRGAALLEPYADDPGNTGLLVTPEQTLPELFDTVLKQGFQLNYHAIGDRANRLALDNFAASFERVGGQALRHRIEHAQVIAPVDIPRFKQLDIIPSMQPVHATSDMNMAGDRLGKARLKGAYAWQRLLQQGSRIAAGSDFPVELANPFHGIHAAVTRQNHQNQPPGGWRSEQAMTVAQALRAFTLDAAYAAHQEQQLGSLEAGKWADFVLIDRDIFTIEPQALWQTRVLETWVAGKRRYQSGSDTAP